MQGPVSEGTQDGDGSRYDKEHPCLRFPATASGKALGWEHYSCHILKRGSCVSLQNMLREASVVQRQQNQLVGEKASDEMAEEESQKDVGYRELFPSAPQSCFSSSQANEWPQETTSEI